MPYYKIVLPRTSTVSQLEIEFRHALLMLQGGYLLKKINNYTYKVTCQHGFESENTVRYYNGKPTCTCPIFRLNQRVHPWCEHILFVLAKARISEDMLTVLIISEPVLFRYLKPTSRWALIFLQIWRRFFNPYSGLKEKTWI